MARVVKEKTSSDRVTVIGPEGTYEVPKINIGRVVYEK